MSKEIYIGQIKGYGKYLCRVTLEIKLQEKPKGLILSICGNVWNNKHTDCYTCGQIGDTLRAALKSHDLVNLRYPRSTIIKLLDIWDRWHLNDLRAGCEHQSAEKWTEIKLDEDKPLTQDNMAVWERPEDHPKGLLTKPCSVCGYKYGTEWLFEPVPNDVVEFVEKFIGSD